MERQSSNSRPVPRLLTYGARKRGVQHNAVGCAAVADQARIECDIVSDHRALSGRRWLPISTSATSRNFRVEFAKRTEADITNRRYGLRFYEFAPFGNGPDEVKSPVWSSRRRCWTFVRGRALRPPHYAVRGTGLDTRGSSDDGHWA